MAPARRGFTILEVMLVLAVIVMLSAMAYPSLESMYADIRVQAAADHLRGRFAQGRTRAIDDGRPYRFAVKPDTGEYKLAPDSPEFWGDGSDAGAANDETYPEPLVLEDTLPSEIVFQFSSFAGAESGGWAQLVTFLPDGSCTADRTIRLEREGARPIELSIRQLTGGVTVQTVKAGGGP